MSEIVSRLRARLQLLGWSQAKLAKTAGVSLNMIESLINGCRPNPRLSTCIKLASALRVSLDWLTGTRVIFPIQVEMGSLAASAQGRLDRARTQSKRRAATLDLLLLHTGALLGLGVAELSELRIEDVDLSRGTAFVGERCVPMPTDLLDRLRSWIDVNASGHVFTSPRGGKLSHQTIYRRLQKLLLAQMRGRQ